MIWLALGALVLVAGCVVHYIRTERDKRAWMRDNLPSLVYIYDAEGNRRVMPAKWLRENGGHVDTRWEPYERR